MLKECVCSWEDEYSLVPGPHTWPQIEGKRGREWQNIRWLGSITDSTDMNLSKLWEIVEERGAWHPTVHGVTESDMTATE